MRAFAYQGDHAEVTLYGVTFPQGVCVPVPDPALIAKLAGNSHFAEGPMPPDEYSSVLKAFNDQQGERFNHMADAAGLPKRRGRSPKA